MSLFLEKLRIMQGILPFGNSVATFEHKGGEQQYTLEMVYYKYGSSEHPEGGCEWYGPLKLNAMFGRTMIDKNELDAVIGK